MQLHAAFEERNQTGCIKPCLKNHRHPARKTRKGGPSWFDERLPGLVMAAKSDLATLVPCPRGVFSDPAGTCHPPLPLGSWWMARALWDLSGRRERGHATFQAPVHEEPFVPIKNGVCGTCGRSVLPTLGSLWLASSDKRRVGSNRSPFSIRSSQGVSGATVTTVSPGWRLTAAERGHPAGAPAPGKGTARKRKGPGP